MRYRGQGHEVAVSLPIRAFAPADAELFLESFEREYRLLYGRTIPRLSLEAMSWSLSLAKSRALAGARRRRAALERTGGPSHPRRLRSRPRRLRRRARLRPERRCLRATFSPAPSLIVEDETSSLVNKNHDVLVNALGYLVLTRKELP